MVGQDALKLGAEWEVGEWGNGGMGEWGNGEFQLKPQHPPQSARSDHPKIQPLSD
ncbi:hypothetical protein PN432_02120 [Microcystis aeruginosa CS-579]|nr:hypothetical protein [Microcystis aeruginosa CS-579]